MAKFKILACTVAALAVPFGGALAQERITLGYVASSAFVSTFVAADQGFFADHGLEVELQRVNVGSTLPAALVANSVQIATLTPPPVLLANEGGLDLRIIAAASYETETNYIAGAIVRPEADIATAADFAGRSVASPGISSAGHIRFVDWLRQNGTDPNTVTFVEIPFPQMADLLTAGTVDAAIITEPFLTRAEQAGVGVFMADYAAATTDPVLVGIYVASAGWAEANAETVAAFRAAMDDAAAWIDANPEEARAVQVEHLGVPEDVAAVMRVPVVDAEIDADKVAYWVDLLRRFDILREDADPASFLVP